MLSRAKILSCLIEDEKNRLAEHERSIAFARKDGWNDEPYIEKADRSRDTISVLTDLFKALQLDKELQGYTD